MPNEKANSEEKKSRKTNCTLFADKQFGIRYAMKRKISERAKSGEMPKAVQRASPRAFAFPFCDLPDLSVRVLVATARSAGALV